MRKRELVVELAAHKNALELARAALQRAAHVHPDPLDAAMDALIDLTKEHDDRIASAAKKAQRAIEALRALR